MANSAWLTIPRPPPAYHTHVQGADPWATDKLGGRTALHYAARGGYVDVVRALLEAALPNGSVDFPNQPGTK